MLHPLDHLHTYVLPYASLPHDGRWCPEWLLRLHRAESRTIGQMIWHGCRTRGSAVSGHQDGITSAYQMVKTFLVLGSSDSQLEELFYLHPRGLLACLGAFLIVPTGGGCYWSPVGRGQGHHCAFYKGQDSPFSPPQSFPKCQQC